MTILEQITELHPIRRSAKQKEAFRKWAMGRMAETGYRVRVEENANGRHQNVVAGNPDTADMTITAHYDTPACIGIPNLMIPRNWAVYLAYQLAVILAMLAIALGVGVGLGAATGSEDMMRVGLLGTYLLLIVFMVYGPANRHNVNDNSSGVAALMQTMALIPPERRSRVAFVLFDNEEKGRQGSKAYAKDHLQVQHTKLIVNLDCVGVGEHFIVVSPRLARNLEAYELLERVLADAEGRQTHFYSSLTTRGSSDFRSFKCGVGISAYGMTPGVGYLTGAIHTWRDTEADQGNLDHLATALSACVNQLPEEE